jgi:hypothetical protein
MNFRQVASIVSVSRRCFVVAGLFRCVVRRRSVGEHQPVPRLERTQPFRAACGNAPPKRARLGPVPLGNDAHHTAGRNRLVRQQVGEHRPAGVVHGLRHVCLRQLLRAHICEVDLRAMRTKPRDITWEEMPTPVGDFRRTRPCANLLPAPFSKDVTSAGRCMIATSTVLGISTLPRWNVAPGRGQTHSRPSPGSCLAIAITTRSSRPGKADACGSVAARRRSSWAGSRPGRRNGRGRTKKRAAEDAAML